MKVIKIADAEERAKVKECSMIQTKCVHLKWILLILGRQNS